VNSREKAVMYSSFAPHARARCGPPSTPPRRITARAVRLPSSSRELTDLQDFRHQTLLDQAHASLEGGCAQLLGGDGHAGQGGVGANAPFAPRETVEDDSRLGRLRHVAGESLLHRLEGKCLGHALGANVEQTRRRSRQSRTFGGKSRRRVARDRPLGLLRRSQLQFHLVDDYSVLRGRKHSRDTPRQSTSSPSTERTFFVPSLSSALRALALGSPRPLSPSPSLASLQCEGDCVVHCMLPSLLRSARSFPRLGGGACAPLSSSLHLSPCFERTKRRKRRGEGRRASRTSDILSFSMKCKIAPPPVHACVCFCGDATVLYSKVSVRVRLHGLYV